MVIKLTFDNFLQQQHKSRKAVQRVHTPTHLHLPSHTHPHLPPPSHYTSPPSGKDNLQFWQIAQLSSWSEAASFSTSAGGVYGCDFGTISQEAAAKRWSHWQGNLMQRTAIHCNILQRSATRSYWRSNSMQHTTTHCNILQHTASLCKTVQRSATWSHLRGNVTQDTATHCNTLQYFATHCNTLQYFARLCNTLQHNLIGESMLEWWCRPLKTQSNAIFIWLCIFRLLNFFSRPCPHI